MIEVTVDIVREFLDYNPETGKFRWKFRDRKYCKDDRSWKIWNSKNAGNSTGNPHHSGYQVIIIFKKRYQAHRLAWLYVYGEWPENDLDHINHIKDDNRIENLRDVTNSQNHMNRSIQTGRTSQYKGVSWHKRDQKWMAQIKINGKKKYLGYFTIEEDAAKAYDKAALEHFGEYANLNFPIEDYLEDAA